MLLLVNVDDDHNLFDGLAAKVENEQQLERASISGKTFIRLKCTVIESNKNDIVHGVLNRTYSETKFKDDYKNRNGGFRIKFDGVAKSRHFNWKDVIEHPSSFMFFGTPLSQTRSFDSIFHSMNSLSTIYHRFMSYYPEFEGDVTSCVALYNAYLHRKAIILSKEIKKKGKDVKNYDGNLFHTDKV